MTLFQNERVKLKLPKNNIHLCPMTLAITQVQDIVQVQFCTKCGSCMSIYLAVRGAQNSFQVWVRIIKSVKKLNDFKGQPHTYLVQKL